MFIFILSLAPIVFLDFYILGVGPICPFFNGDSVAYLVRYLFVILLLIWMFNSNIYLTEG